MLMNMLSDLDLKRSIKRMRKKSPTRPVMLIETKASTTHACKDSKKLELFLATSNLSSFFVKRRTKTTNKFKIFAKFYHKVRVIWHLVLNSSIQNRKQEFCGGGPLIHRYFNSIHQKRYFQIRSIEDVKTFQFLFPQELILARCIAQSW